MFADRFAVLVDACSLFSLLTRNLLLSLAEGEVRRAPHLASEHRVTLLRRWEDIHGQDG